MERSRQLSALWNYSRKRKRTKGDKKECVSPHLSLTARASINHEDVDQITAIVRGLQRALSLTTAVRPEMCQTHSHNRERRARLTRPAIAAFLSYCRGVYGESLTRLKFDRLEQFCCCSVAPFIAIVAVIATFPSQIKMLWIVSVVLGS
jgi:hypothetical protein